MKQVKISQVDVLFSNGIYPIEFLFYYKQGFNTKRIRETLRKLSSVFWPLFGEYKDGLISFDKYIEEDCYDEEVVHQELNIQEDRENGFEEYSRFALPDLKRLFFLKVIRLKNGLALIPKMNHLAGDGYSYFYFLSLLAALSRPTMVPFKSSLMPLVSKPHHRRTRLRDFSFQGVGLKPAFQSEKYAVEYNEIPRKAVRMIIQEAASSDNLRISTNDILAAMAMKKLAAGQSDFLGEDAHLTIPIDVRRQVKEYGRRFFGNGIMLHTINFKREAIENLTIRELAINIRNSMPFVSKETYIKYLTALEKFIAAGKTDELRPFDPSRGVLVTNLSRLPAEKLNFGTGFPELIVPLTVEKNSTAILAKKDNFVLRYAY
jgi:hypothetical protein